MEKFTNVSSVIAPLFIINIDTDMIIPKQFLKTLKRTGLGKNLFQEMRYDESGKEIPEFVLNKPEYKGAKVLLAGDNFGCGSSREHAHWAIADFGIKCIISTSFADIFYNNCFKNGILPVVLAKSDYENLVDDVAKSNRPRSINVDLSTQTINLDSGLVISFNIEESRKHDLINGLDEIGKTLEKIAMIDKFEKDRIDGDESFI